jgi:hypothetical protein
MVFQRPILDERVKFTPSSRWRLPHGLRIAVLFPLMPIYFIGWELVLRTYNVPSITGFFLLSFVVGVVVDLWLRGRSSLIVINVVTMLPITLMAIAVVIVAILAGDEITAKGIGNVLWLVARKFLIVDAPAIVGIIATRRYRGLS